MWSIVYGPFRLRPPRAPRIYILKDDIPDDYPFASFLETPSILAPAARSVAILVGGALALDLRQRPHLSGRRTDPRPAVGRARGGVEGVARRGAAGLADLQSYSKGRRSDLNVAKLMGGT